MLDFALLGFLSFNPMTGYELKHHLDHSTRNIWHAKLSHIYSTLKKLQDKGHVTSDVQPQKDRPDRRVYTITPAGQTSLLKFLSSPIITITPKKDLFLLKILFSAHIGKDSVLTQLRLMRDLQREQLDTTQKDLADLSKLLDKTEESELRENTRLLWDSVVSLEEQKSQLQLRWLDELINQVEESFNS